MGESDLCRNCGGDLQGLPMAALLCQSCSWRAAGRPLRAYGKFIDTAWNSGPPMWVLAKRIVLLAIFVITTLFTWIVSYVFTVLLVFPAVLIYLYFYSRMYRAMRGRL